MYTVIKLRRVAVLLFTFGAGWLTAQMASPWILVLYGVAVILWFMFYDFAVENRNENIANQSTETTSERIQKVTHEKIR